MRRSARRPANIRPRPNATKPAGGRIGVGSGSSGSSVAAHVTSRLASPADALTPGDRTAIARWRRHLAALTAYCHEVVARRGSTGVTRADWWGGISEKTRHPQTPTPPRENAKRSTVSRGRPRRTRSGTFATGGYVPGGRGRQKKPRRPSRRPSPLDGRASAPINRWSNP